jgi:phosphate transport system substrate-binding protein
MEILTPINGGQKMRKRILPVLMLGILIFGSNPAAAEEGALQIKGSDTMVNLGQGWAEEFMTENPDASVAVTGGGSGTGIAAIINGSCDIAQASRKMKDQEFEMAKAKGRQIEEFEVAVDALEVIVHPSNPIGQLTIEQLSGIFTGTITNWKEVGGIDQAILVLSRERNSGTHVYFLEHVLRKGNDKGPEEYGPRALMLPSSQAIVEEVAQSTGAIGYVGMGYVSERQKKIAVGTEPAGPFVLPSLESAIDKSYPIARPLLMYAVKPVNPTVRSFLEFVLSDRGQQIVREMDFVPVQKKI